MVLPDGDPPLTRKFRDAPRDIRQFVERWENCEHWYGEYGYDRDRGREIERALNNLRCNDLGRDGLVLEQKYGRNSLLIRRLRAAIKTRQD